MLSTGALEHRDPHLRSQWYFPPWHLYYFSRVSMFELLARERFTVLSYSEHSEAAPEYALMTVIARPDK